MFVCGDNALARENKNISPEPGVCLVGKQQPGRTAEQSGAGEVRGAEAGNRATVS